MLSSEDYASIIKSVAVDLGVAPTDSTLHCNVSWYCKGLDIRDTMRNDTKDARNAAIAKIKSSKRFRPKLTTVKLFRSGRINLDHVNDHDQAVTIRAFIVDQIKNNWSEVVYYDDDE
ncbi:hypothetical protein PC112_g11158 [Phytophthora cactorum]|nr:hypothetical protein PC112_g11158 [Phytophthora cactorum]